ncbi:hypothetical protein I4U23_027292 [Adineta vaga]|nr:hypothetical protein I4U23_027292 [Adineta vaga]
MNFDLCCMIKVHDESYNISSVFNLSSPISIDEGESLLIQAPSDYDRIYWWCDDNEELPRSLYRVGNSLEILKATSDHNREHIIVSCTYKHDGTSEQISYEIRVRRSQTS